MKRVSAVLTLSCFAPMLYAGEAPPCRTRRDLVGECRVVQGRLYVMNGIPLQVWVVGTRRVLAVPEDIDQAGRFQLAQPQEFLEAVDFRTRLYGDFEVCPLTREKPGEMQWVCIESGDEARPGTSARRWFCHGKTTSTGLKGVRRG